MASLFSRRNFLFKKRHSYNIKDSDLERDPANYNIHDSPHNHVDPNSKCVEEIKKSEYISRSKFKIVSGVEGISTKWCYMDSSLNSIFLFTSIFHQILDATQNKSSQVENLRRILTDEIFSSLSARQSLKQDTGIMSSFRDLLLEISPDQKWNEMDPQEFISSLFGDILKTPAFYFFEGNSAGSYVFQTYADMSKPTAEIDVQTLLEYSFVDSDLKLGGIPQSGFIIKMPVTEGRQSIFSKIYPNPDIELGNILREKHEGGHKFSTSMLLSAVICLSGDHFTAYVREGENRNSPWWYLDSFSYSGGVLVPDMNKNLEKHLFDGRHMSFLMSNCYMCFYLPMPKS